MKKLGLLAGSLALTLSAGAMALDTSVRGISLGDNAQEAKSKLDGKVASAEMQAAREFGLKGFVETMGKTEDYELRAELLRLAEEADRIETEGPPGDLRWRMMRPFVYIETEEILNGRKRLESFSSVLPRP